MRRLAVALAALVAASALSGCLEGGLVGQPSPRFQLVTSDGQVVNETTHLGKYVVLDLMATWCGPCKLEVGHLREVQARYGDRVEILSIGVDPDESPADLAAFAEKHGATWPHGLDVNGSIGRAFGLRIIPKLVILDPEGRVVFERQGEVLPAAIARVVDPNAPAAPREGLLAVAGGAALAAVLGFLAPLNPYRRFHRDAGRPAPAWLAVGGFALLALAAWPLSGLVSTRATYGSLALGLVAAGAVLWWGRARGKEAPAPRPHRPLLEAGDRLYEAAPHFALALVLGLNAPGALGFFAPLAAFLAGAALAVPGRESLPPETRTPAGLLGLALAAAGLLVFGGRILVA